MGRHVCNLNSEHYLWNSSARKLVQLTLSRKKEKKVGGVKMKFWVAMSTLEASCKVYSKYTFGVRIVCVTQGVKLGFETGWIAEPPKGMPRVFGVGCLAKQFLITFLQISKQVRDLPSQPWRGSLNGQEPNWHHFLSAINPFPFCVFPNTFLPPPHSLPA